MNPQTFIERPFVCHQSSICTALACERCWYYRERLGITLRKQEINRGASLGTIYHKFQQFGPGGESRVKDWVREKQAALMKQVEVGEDLDGSIIRNANMLTDLYNRAEAMAHLFWERYPQPDYLKIVQKELNVKMSFMGLDLEGTIDQVCQNTEDGTFWIRDHKSTSQNLQVIFGGLSWAVQARMYRLLFEAYMSNPDAPSYALMHCTQYARGFIMDGILVPGIKLCRTDEANAKKWNCSVNDAYLRRVKEWYREKDKDAMLSKGILYNEPILSREFENVLSYMDLISKKPVNLPFLFQRDMTRRACFSYNRVCMYHDLCETPMEYWGPMFEMKYQFSDVKTEEIETTETEAE